MRLERKVTCGECPFRKASAPGWLGPWTAQSMIRQAHSEGGLGCHVSATKEKCNPETTHVCVGSLMNANISCKSYVNPVLREWAKLVGRGKDILNVFEFYKHHEAAHGEEDET